MQEAAGAVGATCEACKIYPHLGHRVPVHSALSNATCPVTLLQFAALSVDITFAYICTTLKCSDFSVLPFSAAFAMLILSVIVLITGLVHYTATYSACMHPI
jgi:hypothetical protein